MSDAAVEKFRTMKEQDKADAIAGERFRNALASVVVTPENLSKLIRRCDSGSQLRSVHKLNWWIDAGFLLGREIDTVTLIGFFSRLAPDEIKMSDKVFAATWDTASSKKLRAARIRCEVIPADPKPKSRLPRRSLEYKQIQMAKRHCQDETPEIQPAPTC